MSRLETGQAVHVRAASARFSARVLLVGDERDVVLDVEGAGGVHRFLGLRRGWRAADEARWTHGDVEIELAAEAPARIAARRGRSGW